MFDCIQISRYFCYLLFINLGDLFGKKGFVEVQIESKSLPFLDPREEHLLGIHAEDIMTSFRNLACFTGSGMRVEDIERILGDTDFQGFPVIQSLKDPIIQGYITRGDLDYVLRKSLPIFGLLQRTDTKNPRH